MLLELRRTLGLAPSARDDSRDKWSIDAGKQGLRERIQEFWRYRRIFVYFGKRAVTRMYQGTTLGVFWLFARPLLPILIGAFIFGRFLGVPSEGMPYFLFFLTGQVTWMLFERSLLWVTRSLDQQKSLIKKMYFPRLIVPFSAVSPALVDYAIYMLLFLATLVYYFVKTGVWYLQLTPRLPMALVAVALAVWFAVGLGLWTTVLQARFRDVRFTLRYVTRFWFYLTPVIYPISAVPPEHHWMIFVNPMASIVETFKWATLGVGGFYGDALLASFVLSTVVFAGGLWYFGQSEAVAVDKL
jgi:lipopolysaccharide transport system permease protein